MCTLGSVMDGVCIGGWIDGIRVDVALLISVAVCPSMLLVIISLLRDSTTLGVLATVSVADEGIETEFDGSTSIVVPDAISVLVKVCNSVAVWRTSVLRRLLKLVPESVARDVIGLTVG